MRNFKFILFFIIIFIIGDRFISSSLISLSKYSSLPYAKIYTERAKSDILILGDSRAYHHLNENDWTVASSYKTFSLSMTGSPMLLQEVLLKDYIVKYGNPKLIAIELNSLISPFDKILSLKYLGLMSDNFQNLMSEYYYKHYMLCKTFNLLFLNSIDYLNMLHKIFVRYSQPILFGNITEDELIVVRENGYSPYFQNRKYNLKSLERIIEDYGDDIKIIFIITPFNKNFLEKQHEKDKWMHEVRQIIPSKMQLYDYSSSIINNEYYFDDRHLNDKGVKNLLDIMIRENFFENLI